MQRGELAEGFIRISRQAGAPEESVNNVIPAKTGICPSRLPGRMPAFAGMTVKNYCRISGGTASALSAANASSSPSTV